MDSLNKADIEFILQKEEYTRIRQTVTSLQSIKRVVRKRDLFVVVIFFFQPGDTH